MHTSKAPRRKKLYQKRCCNPTILGAIPQNGDQIIYCIWDDILNIYLKSGCLWYEKPGRVQDSGLICHQETNHQHRPTAIGVPVPTINEKGEGKEWTSHGMWTSGGWDQHCKYQWQRSRYAINTLNLTWKEWHCYDVDFYVKGRERIHLKGGHHGMPRLPL